MKWLLAFLRRWFMADNLPPLPVAPALATWPIPAPGHSGVLYTAPPASILPAIQRHLDAATSGLEVGDIALAAVADRKGGWNTTIVAKLPKGVSADVFVGKSWGTDAKLDWGVRVLKVWKVGGSK